MRVFASTVTVETNLIVSEIKFIFVDYVDECPTIFHWGEFIDFDVVFEFFS